MNDKESSSERLDQFCNKNNELDRMNKLKAVIFWVLLISLYTTILVLDQSYFPLGISNISFSGFMIIVLLIKSGITHNHIIIMIMLSKLLSMIILIFLDSQNLLLLTFLLVDIDYGKQTITFIEQTTVQVASLALVCYKGNLISIISLISVVLMQCQKNYQYKSMLSFKNADNKSHLSLKKISLRQSGKEDENLWKNRLQSIPAGVIIISLNDWSIIFKNSAFYSLFNQFCKTEEEFENLLMNQINFSVTPNNFEENEISSINEILKRRIKKCQFLGLPNISQKQQETSQDVPNGPQSLNDILHNFKSKNNNTSSYISMNHFNQFELTCRQQFYDGTYLQLFGQIVQNEKDNEIIIILSDISSQNELQQQTIFHDFKTKILQSFSHELRTPLNSALNFLTTLLNEQTIPKQIKENLVEPAVSSLKIQKLLINDIIDFSTFYSAQITIKLREFTISELTTDITSMFFYQFNAKQLAFSVDLKDNILATLCTDYQKLLQILVNLIQNSLKYSFKGGCILKLVPLANQNILFEISDQGTGIPLNLLQKLQSISRNVEKNKEFVKDWHGLGLLISSIILQHLAPTDMKYFEIRSEGENKGTQISFQIKNFIKLPTSSQNLKYSTSNYCHFGSIVSQAKNLTTSQQLQGNGSLFNVVGTVIKATDYHIVSNQIKTQFAQFNSKKSYNDSFCSDSNDDYLERRLNDLGSFNTLLITDINNVNSKFRDKSSKIINLKQIKQLEERESEIFITELNNMKRCNCMRILSVDDEIFNQKSLQYLISKLGFEVLIAYNGQQAIQILQQLQRCSPNCCLLQLILMDYQMPIMNGIETTKQIIGLMNRQQIPQIHIVGLTAFTEQQDIDNCIKAGMTDVLGKPLNLQELKNILYFIFKN